jgi:hypothetical protein
MSIRVSWDRYEVALLFAAYDRVAGGSDINTEAARLSQTLRALAIRRGFSIDDTYRNLNGMKMQLANVQYLFTDGQRGLSGASAMIRQMYELYRASPMEYQTILKEAIRLTDFNASIEDAFFAYAKERIGLSPRMLAEYLQKAADYCHLKQPLLGMTDVKAVRNVQQKVAEGKLLRFRYGKDAQTIRNVTQLYYTFIKSYREPKDEPPVQTEATAGEEMIPTQSAPVEEESIIETPVVPQPVVIAVTPEEPSDESSTEVLPEETIEEQADERLFVDFNLDNSYLFTKPVSYTYRGVVHPAYHWIRVYRGICQLLFDDYREVFMTVINGDIPGENTLAFADEQNAKRMRSPKGFAPGYYLEANLDATSIVRKICGLHKLFGLTDELRIKYRTLEGYQPSDSKLHREINSSGQIPEDTGYDWQRSGLLLVDLTEEASYAFTQPEAYEYKGLTRRVNKWGKLYADLCGALFEDYQDAFMGIMNGDIPGYSALAFADEQHKSEMRVARCFAPGYYLESNMDATSIVRRIRGLYRLFELGDSLRISYTRQGDTKVDPVHEASGEEWLIHELRSLKIPYVDNRSIDGCLWIASDMSIPLSLNEAAERGYRLRLKPDGCRAYPNRPVLWTKDQPKKAINTADFRRWLDESFKPFLLSAKKLAVPTAAQYSQSVEAVERFMLEHRMDCTLDTTEPDEAQRIYDMLMERQDFVDWNNTRHHQYSAALAQYISYLRQDKPDAEDPDPGKALTIKDAAVIILQEAGQPLTVSEILQRIEEKNLYKFGSSGATNLYISIRRYCKGMESRHHAPVDVFERFTDEAGQIRYKLIGENTKPGGSAESRETLPVDERWLPILQDAFPDGYILQDLLGQFQAATFWQERYGEECPIQGNSIDAAMKAVGVVRDGRVFVKSEEDKQLIANICREINEILSRYTTVYRSCIYESYQEQLASISIYTEQVMTQQLLTEAKGSFYSVNQVFAKPGQFASVIQDARKVLRDHGGPMPVGEVAKVLWFIPRDMVYHYLSVDDESLNIGNSTWMLAEHFPVTHEDAAKIGNMLDEYFLSNSYVQAFDLMPLLRDRLPGIADNLSGMTYQAVFNIVAYYLRDRFNFTKAIISPKGTSIDFTDLFRAFAAERDTFTLTDLEALASELKLPIYWESTYAGGAVRVSKTEFVNKRLIQFDVDAIDAALADFCPGDYLPLMSVSSAMMMHLPSCGYRWNGYLLQSYVFGFSKVFRLSYSSFGKTGYYGAMVRRSCKTINNYGSLIERVLTDDDTWETTADALDVLVNCGYQAMRKYKGIDNVVAQARRNKLPDDGR